MSVVRRSATLARLARLARLVGSGGRPPPAGAVLPEQGGLAG
ncbi:hypothetical protein [Frankia sp. Cppng1_Ct_nod]|nr:hypothetical protein [Frankia sp. Cppng1_Ct_nod]